MIKLKHVPVLLASCLLIGGLGTDVSAQDRSWDRERSRERAEDRDWRGRDRDDDDRGARRRDRDDDFDRRGRAWDRNDDDDDDDDDDDRRWRGRDRDDDDRRWRGRERWWGGYDRGRNCYTIRRRFVEPDGDVIIRRSRVCEY